MSSSFIMSKDSSNFRSSYTSAQILHFRSRVEVSSLEDEDWVILEAYSLSERVTMIVPFNPLSP